MDAYLNLVMQNMRSQKDADWLCPTLLAIIAFSGFFARRLAELDVLGAHREQWDRDYRKEINRLSIYASKTIRKRIAEIEDYSWVGVISKSTANEPAMFRRNFATIPWSG